MPRGLPLQQLLSEMQEGGGGDLHREPGDQGRPDHPADGGHARHLLQSLGLSVVNITITSRHVWSEGF